MPTSQGNNVCALVCGLFLLEILAAAPQGLLHSKIATRPQLYLTAASTACRKRLCAAGMPCRAVMRPASPAFYVLA